MARKPQINIEKDLCELLRECYRGSESPVASKALEAIFSVKGSEIRRAVNTLRCKGEPICSNIDGYFYAADQHELDANRSADKSHKENCRCQRWTSESLSCILRPYQP